MVLVRQKNKKHSAGCRRCCRKARKPDSLHRSAGISLADLGVILLDSILFAAVSREYLIREVQEKYSVLPFDNMHGDKAHHKLDKQQYRHPFSVVLHKSGMEYFHNDS